MSTHSNNKLQETITSKQNRAWSTGNRNVQSDGADWPKNPVILIVVAVYIILFFAGNWSDNDNNHTQKEKRKMKKDSNQTWNIPQMAIEKQNSLNQNESWRMSCSWTSSQAQWHRSREDEKAVQNDVCGQLNISLGRWEGRGWSLGAEQFQFILLA